MGGERQDSPPNLPYFDTVVIGAGIDSATIRQWSDGGGSRTLAVHSGAVRASFAGDQLILDADRAACTTTQCQRAKVILGVDHIRRLVLDGDGHVDALLANVTLPTFIVHINGGNESSIFLYYLEIILS